MKKLLITMFVLSLGLVTMAAAPKAAPAAPPPEEWSAMDLGIWFGLPTSMETANVRGCRLGMPISFGKGYVRGVEFALFCAATDNVEGLQLSCVDLSKKISGTQISLVNVCCGLVQGSQIGIVNSAGQRGWQIGIVNSSTNAKFQLGLINLNKDGLWPFSFLVNFGKDTFKSADEIRAEQAPVAPKKK
ncbi:MAG: hypothetical protein PHH77_01235 [Victivallaceae bacterium]|nr:hypothetical protein [Victivallaceae bacterium]